MSLLMSVCSMRVYRQNDMASYGVGLMHNVCIRMHSKGILAFKCVHEDAFKGHCGIVKKYSQPKCEWSVVALLPPRALRVQKDSFCLSRWEEKAPTFLLEIPN